MTATLDQVMESITRLTNTIQEKKAEGGNPKTELKWDDIKKDFEADVNALVEKQVEAKLAAQPQRPGAGDAIPAGSGDALKGNRYAKMLKNFERDGEHKEGGTSLKPVDLAIAALMMDTQVKRWGAGLELGDAPKAASSDLKAALKAMDSTTAGAGDELVPTNLLPRLWDDFFLASRVAANLQRIDMPTNPFDVPLGLGAVTWRKGTQNQATSQSNPSTDKVTLTATELVTEQAWSYTLEEDAVIAMAPAIRARLAQSGAEAMDAFALNADATSSSSGNINSDDTTPDADSYFLSDGQDGIRHQYLVDNTAMGADENGDLVDATIMGEMALMGKYAVDPTQLMFICDVGTYLNGFLGTGTGEPGEYTITMDKFGMGALVLTGQLAAYRGVPIIISASHPLTAADGKVDALTPGNNAKGGLSIVNRQMWYVGFRRNLLVEADRDIRKRQYVLVTSFRQAIAAHGTRASATHTGGLINITV